MRTVGRGWGKTAQAREAYEAAKDRATARRILGPWWAACAPSDVDSARDRLAAALAAARGDALAPVRAVIEGAQEEIDADRWSAYSMGMDEVAYRIRVAIGDNDIGCDHTNLIRYPRPNRLGLSRKAGR